MTSLATWALAEEGVDEFGLVDGFGATGLVQPAPRLLAGLFWLVPGSRWLFLWFVCYVDCGLLSLVGLVGLIVRLFI